MKVLHQGVRAWNRWRKEKPRVVPDLTGAELGGVHLRGANLSKTTLNQAFLREAKLIDCDLRGA